MNKKSLVLANSGQLLCREEIISGNKKITIIIRNSELLKSHFNLKKK